MSDDVTQAPGEAAAETETGQDATADDDALGVWLRAGREAAGLGHEAVAAALHLDPGVIAALEADDFAALGAPVFVKGHLRALAGHLGLDAEEALRRYTSTAGTSGTEPPELVVQYQQPLRRNRVQPVLVGLAGIAGLAIVVALILFFVGGAGFGGGRAVSQPPAADASNVEVPTSASVERFASSTDAPTGSEAPAMTEEADTPSADFASRLAEARARSTQAPTAAVAQTPAGATTSPPTRAAAAGSGLELTFSEACWYEVRDAEGTRLATGTAAPGDTRRVDGPRPLSLTLGVADAATLTLDGAPVDIPASARRGRSARLTLR